MKKLRASQRAARLQRIGAESFEHGQNIGPPLAAAQQDPSLPQPTLPGSTLMTNRLLNLQNTLGMEVIPSLEGREGSEEAVSAGVNIGILRDPPKPPGRE